jgi:hypothetical protein
MPAKTIYLTDGPNNAVLIRRRSISFNTLTRKRWPGLKVSLRSWFRHSGTLGKDAIGPCEIEKLRSTLSHAEKRRLVKDARFGVDWIYEGGDEDREDSVTKVAPMPKVIHQKREV